MYESANRIEDQLELFSFGSVSSSPTADAVKLRRSSALAVITGIHTSAVLLKSDCTCGSAAMAVDIISSTSSNLADNLSNSLAISIYPKHMKNKYKTQ